MGKIWRSRERQGSGRLLSHMERRADAKLASWWNELLGFKSLAAAYPCQLQDPCMCPDPDPCPSLPLTAFLLHGFACKW